MRKLKAYILSVSVRTIVNKKVEEEILCLITRNSAGKMSRSGLSIQKTVETINHLHQTEFTGITEAMRYRTLRTSSESPLNGATCEGFYFGNVFDEYCPQAHIEITEWR